MAVDGDSRVFLNEPRSIGAARDFVGSALGALGLEDVVACLVTSELATNAVRHAQTQFRVSLTIDDDTIRIEVEDGAGSEPIITEMTSEATGRGLVIVENAATSWGVERRGHKKAIWVELPAVTA